VEDEFFHADNRTNGQTDVTRLTNAFCSFANTPKMIKIIFAYFIIMEM